MAKLTESTLRRIIKEELLEMMGTISKQSDVMPEPPPIYPLRVSVKPSPNEKEDAVQKAIQRAMSDYPGFKFDLNKAVPTGSPNRMGRGDVVDYVVYLKPSK
jgi:hypothetical protein